MDCREIYKEGEAMNKIITVSRQFGSGGRTIAREVAHRLNIPCYDHELIEKVEKDSGFTKEYINENGECASMGILTSMFGTSFGRDLVWTSQCKVICQLAGEGPCVVVGRCADYILQGKADLLKVFIHADIKKRAERIVTVYGESDVAPKKLIKEMDKRRASYYSYYTDEEWGIASNYDIALDSGKFGIDKCIDLIVDLYKKSPV